MHFRRMGILPVVFSLVAVVAPIAAASAATDTNPGGVPSPVVTVSCRDGAVSVDDVPIDVPCEAGGVLELRTAPWVTTLVLDDPTMGILDVRAPGPLTLTGTLTGADAIDVEAGTLEVSAVLEAETIALSSPNELAVSGSLAASRTVDLFAPIVGVALHPTSVVEAPTVVVRGGNVSAAGAIVGDRITLTSPASGETLVTGALTAPGGRIVVDGGAVGLLGPEAGLGAGAVVDAGGELGGGRVTIGDSAASTYLGVDTVVTVDAGLDGDGGTVRIWSNDTTTSFATITARGGRRGGSGGRVEVSGRRTSNVYGDIDVTGAHGDDGEALLDPLTFMLLPQGVLLQLTAIDDLDAVSFKASPSPILDSGAFVGQYFCELVGLASCGVPTSPSLTDYRLRYWSTNTIIGLLTGPLNPSKKLRDYFKPLRIRGPVTFLQPSTLETFEGDIRLEAIFGITLLHGLVDGEELYDAVGIPLDWIPSPFTPDGELQLDHQGPGDRFSAATPFTIVSIGDITTSGGDIAFEAGVDVPADEIQAWVEEMVDENFSLEDLAEMRVEDLIAAAVADAAADDDIQAMVEDLSEITNLLCGGCVPDLTVELSNVIVPADGTRYTLANVTAIPPLLAALGVDVPGWVDDLTDTLDEIDTYASWIPSGTDLVDAALGGITIDVLGVPGEVTSVCWGIESGGKCYDLFDPPTDGLRGYRGLLGECGLIDTGNGRCWIIEPNPGTEIGYDEQCNLGLGIWQDDECWTIPPATVTIPGLHDADPSIPPSFAALISDTLAPLVADGIADLIDEAAIAAGLGPVPDTLRLPPLSLAERTGGALLYVAGDVDARGGTVTLSNASPGLIAVADTISGGRIVVDGPDAAFRNARYDLGTVLTLAGVDQDLVGDAAAAILRAGEIDISTGDGIGDPGAPITLRPEAGALDLVVDDGGDGVWLRFDRDAVVAGSLEGAAGAHLVVDGDVDLSAVEVVLPATGSLVVELDGAVVLPTSLDGAAVAVTGGTGDDLVRTRALPGTPVDVDGGDGDDTLELLLDETPTQDAYGTLEIAGTAGVTYRNVERITGLAPTLLTPVAPVTVPEGAEWPVLVRWIDWGASSWTVAVDWNDGTDGTFPRRRSAAEADTRIVEATVARTFADDGLRDVALSVTDDQDGIGATASLRVEVTNVAPVVAVPDVAPVGEGDAVEVAATFTDPGADDAHTATVDWGDGTSTTASITEGADATEGTVTASHVYADDGTYTVRVCVTDDDGGSGCDETTLEVTNRIPTVDAGEDRSLAEGERWFLDPARYHDAGTADTHLASVDWGDGTIETAPVTEAPYGPPGDEAGTDGTVAASHVYADDGTYTVRVCVLDDEGTGSCDTLEAEVTNVLPVVDAPSGRGEEGSPIGLGVAIADAGTADLLTGTVDWGDGTPAVDAELRPGPTPGSWTTTATHVYADDGTYTVRVCVADDDAGDLPVCADGPVTVTNAAPVVEPIPTVTGIEGRPTAVTVPFTDPGSADTFTATVDWGDGSAPETVDAAAGSVTLPEHGFVQDGTYTGTVCIRDDGGAEACTEITFEITNAAPRISAEPATGVEGAPVPLTVETSDDGVDDHLEVIVDWGDGSADRFDVPGHGGGRLAPEHRYLDDGTYPVRVCVVDEEGDGACTTSEATIGNVEPHLQVGRPGSVVEGAKAVLRVLVDDPGPVDVHTVTIRWGDGSVDVLTGEAVDAAHRYDAPGTATVVVCVDDGTDTVCRTFDLEVTNAPVVLDPGTATADPSGTGVRLEALRALDGGLPTDVTVDWGDGSSPELVAAGSLPIHTYAASGSYEIEVCAVDDDGAPVCERTVVAVESPLRTAGVELPAGGDGAPVWAWLLVLVGSLLGAGVAALRLLDDA
ncbi:MAG TPA: hypothetical protein ENK55_12430 [Actinobacteria bacterium]|nr:hypothetical protein [Actinomycetota bacterium]